MTQGYMIAVLADRAAGGRAVVVAGTHLKAKEGGPNDETRRLQVSVCVCVLGGGRRRETPGCTDLHLLKRRDDAVGSGLREKPGL
jgi:hypothetical protein